MNYKLHPKLQYIVGSLTFMIETANSNWILECIQQSVYGVVRGKLLVNYPIPN